MGLGLECDTEEDTAMKKRKCLAKKMCPFPQNKLSIKSATFTHKFGTDQFICGVEKEAMTEFGT